MTCLNVLHPHAWMQFWVSWLSDMPLLPLCRQTLETELKLLRDDCHRVTLELQQRRLRMGRLEAKFDVMSKRNKSVYEEDEPKSQAYYVIKNAQEREELQKTGDVLDGENQRLEREVPILPSFPNLRCLLWQAAGWLQIPSGNCWHGAGGSLGTNAGPDDREQHLV